MITIEFCCGRNKSISKVLAARGHKTFTLDIDNKCKPDLCIDILDFDISMLPEEFRHPDFIWFSPPCTQYSHAKRTGIRDLKAANSIVQKCLAIKDKLQPKYFILENPQTGLLKNQNFMLNIPYTDISYCKYGEAFRKQTRLWNNLLDWKARPVCNKDCDSMSADKKKHIGSVGNYRKKYAAKSLLLRERYAIPKQLCEEIVNCLEKTMEVTAECKEDSHDDGFPPNNKLLGILWRFL